MHPRWIMTLGIGSGVLLSALVFSSGGVVRGTELPRDESLPTEIPSYLPPAAQPPVKHGVEPRVDQGTAPRAASWTPVNVGASEAVQPEMDDEDKALEDALESQLAEAFRNASLEARDEAWAASMEKVLTSVLDRIVEQAPVTVGKPDCRTQHCMFDVRWADRAAALTIAGDVFSELPEECAVTMTHIDEEQDEYDAYKSRMLLDCARSPEPQR